VLEKSPHFVHWIPNSLKAVVQTHILHSNNNLKKVNMQLLGLHVQFEEIWMQSLSPISGLYNIPTIALEPILVPDT
jgi:hypothetical protein